MNILFIGDIVGRLGRVTTKKVLSRLRKRDSIKLILANGENLASGRGVTAKVIKEIEKSGVGYFTSGEHVFRQEGFVKEIDSLPILRPDNLTPKGVSGVLDDPFDHIPGKGHTVIELEKGVKILLINLIGSTFMKYESRNPFDSVDEILESYNKEDLCATLIDFHAEATSEKIAMAHYLDGRVSAVLGTHTHVATADERVLPGGTAFVTDVGMVGSQDSVIGVKKEIIINRFKGVSYDAFEWQNEGPSIFNSVLIDIDESTGKAKSIKRIDKVIKK